MVKIEQPGGFSFTMEQDPIHGWCKRRDNGLYGKAVADEAAIWEALLAERAAREAAERRVAELEAEAERRRARK